MRNFGTPMKRSNRNALVRRVVAWVKAGKFSKAEAVPLLQLIREGVASRRMVYGFRPTKAGYNGSV